MLACLLILHSAASAGTNCRILALGGGSDRGAYQAGAIVGLINSLPAGEAEWDVVTGTGVGALNGLFVSQYSKGNEAEVAKALLSFWSSFKTSQFYQNWYGWFITGIEQKSGLYDTTPMTGTIQKLSAGGFQRFFGVGTCDLVTGSYVYFNSTGQNMTSMRIGVLASASEPGIFPLVEYKTFKLITGSVKLTVDLLQGVQQCFSQGFQQNQIIIDVILGAGKLVEPVDASNYKTLQVISRFQEISSYVKQLHIIDDTLQAFNQINMRSVILPKKKLRNPEEPYGYGRKYDQMLIQLGQDDAKAEVGKYFKYD